LFLSVACLFELPVHLLGLPLQFFCCVKISMMRSAQTPIPYQAARKEAKQAYGADQSSVDPANGTGARCNSVCVLQLNEVQARAMLAWITDGDDEERRFAMEQITILLPALSASQEGSRVVQKYIDFATPCELVAFADQLRGRVKEASRCPHANHVLQRFIEELPTDCVQFIVDELQGNAVVTARNKFACRIFQRLIECCPIWQVSALIEEAMSDADRLCRHPFGNFVMQHILERGTEAHRGCLIAIIVPVARGLANHKVGCHVLHRALASSTIHDREMLEVASAGMRFAKPSAAVCASDQQLVKVH